jgi:hypothetical protein
METFTHNTLQCERNVINSANLHDHELDGKIEYVCSPFQAIWDYNRAIYTYFLAVSTFCPLSLASLLSVQISLATEPHIRAIMQQITTYC